MWLLWLLHDEKNPSQAHYGWSEDLITYVRINQTIGERLADLGRDAGARDTVRHLRIPGSFHTGAERDVEWQIHLKGLLVNSYTLQELVTFFGITTPKRSPIEREILADKPHTERWKGHRQANANKLAAFVRLKELRGAGFDEGMRSKAAYIYALILRANKADKKRSAASGFRDGTTLPTWNENT